MKISINDKYKFNDSLKGLHSKNYLVISSNYSVEYLYKLLKNNQRIINNKDDNNETFLSYAIKRKNIPIIDLLLTSPLLDYSYQNLQGNSYLHLSVIYEIESAIKTLIQKGIDINMKNEDGNTALHYAYSVNNYNIIILLIQNRIDFTIKNNQGLIAEEIKPNSLIKDDLTKNNNNQRNKSIIIDWDTNFNLNENNNDSIIKDNRDNFIYQPKNKTPIAFKKLNKVNNDIKNSVYKVTNDIKNSVYKKKGKGFYLKDKSKNNQSYFYFIQKSSSLKDLRESNGFHYNNTEQSNKKRNFFNNLLDSKQETIRKNIFDSRILPSNHQINYHICDLNYLNNYQNNKLKNSVYKKISKSQYFVKDIKIKNFSPIKINDRYENDSDRSGLNSARSLRNENILEEIKPVNGNINKRKINNNDIIKIKNDNNNNKNDDNNNNKDNKDDDDDDKNNKDNNDIDSNDDNNSINHNSTNDSCIKNNTLYHFLSKIKMEKYFHKLQQNGFDDINLLISQTKTESPITDLQLKEIGIDNLGDRTRILIRLEEKANNFGFSLPNDVYYICDNICNIDINEDYNVNKLFEWLNKINVGEYLDNFLINGYYNIELLLVQMLSKNPINDEILRNEIEINKIGHRSRILNALDQDSKDFQRKFKKKGFFIISGKEPKACDCIIF